MGLEDLLLFRLYSTPTCLFHVHIVSNGPSILLVAGLPPHWLLLLRCLHPVLQPLPGRWGIVITERPSHPLHMWSFARCVRCRFQYALFLHCGGRCPLPFGLFRPPGAWGPYQLPAVSLPPYFRVQLCLWPYPLLSWCLKWAPSPPLSPMMPRSPVCFPLVPAFCAGMQFSDDPIRCSCDKLSAAPRMILVPCTLPPPHAKGYAYHTYSTANPVSIGI